MAKKNKRRGYSAKARGKPQKSSRSVQAVVVDTPKRDSAQSDMHVKVRDLITLVLDVWRLYQRAQHEGVPEKVQLAIERTLERLRGLGFDWKTLEGQPYDPKAKIHVIDDRGPEDTEERIIVECLTPAIYYREVLIEPAKIVIGGKNDGKADR